MTVDQERALRGLIAAGSGIEPELVIPGYDRGPRPSQPFLTVTLVGEVTVGVSAAARDAAGEEHIRQNRQATFSVQSVNADAALDALVLWCDSADCRAEEVAAGLRVIHPIKVAQADTAIDAKWEPRLVVSLTVEYASLTTREVTGLQRVDPIDLVLEENEARVSATVRVE